MPDAGVEKAGFFGWLERRAERRHRQRLELMRARAETPVDPWFHWPDARGWIGLAIFGLTVMCIWMLRDKELREDEFFKTIATAIILTGFINGVVSWAYAATKQGGELADRAAGVAEQAATGTGNGNGGQS